MTAQLFKTGFSRVFFHEGQAGPNVAPAYQGLWKAGGLSWGRGDLTTIKAPSETEYDKFDVVDSIQGEPANPQVTINARYTMDRSKLLAVARTNCTHDMQVHMGSCKNPQDFNGGWSKVLIIESARITDYGTDDLGALAPDERSTANENVTFQGQDMYEIGPISFGQQAAALVGREVVGIYVCDSTQCASCGRTSDGCQVVFAVAIPSAGSAGLLPTVFATENGGAEWRESVISSMGATDVPRAVLCVGDYLVVLEPLGTSYHVATTADVLDNGDSATWTEVTTGFVAAKGPRAAISVSPTLTFIAGRAGYIYKATAIADGVAASDSAGNTVQDLNAIDAYDANNVVVVGNSNAVVYTTNGGESWNAVTGPSVGVNLNTVAMRSATEWWVGTASGRLYYTTDSGTTWVEKAFAGSGAGAVQDIKWASRVVGYLSHTTATPHGRIFRTLDGGFSWYLTPEVGTLTANDRVTSLATCSDPNTIFAGGLADDATDGIIVKGSSSAS